MDTAITTKRGLSDFGLKYLAAICMVLDHIHYFFEYTGKVPLIFSQIGRISAPIFLFCLVEGFCHTQNRLKYFLRIYVISILMGAIQFSFYNVASGLVRADGFFPQNQMLSSFVILLVVLQGFDWCAKKKWLPGILAIVLPIILPFIAVPLFTNQSTAFMANLLAFTLFPLHSAIADGGTATLLAGIIFYLFRKDRKKQLFGFVVFTILWDIVRIWFSMPGLQAMDFLTYFYEWLEIFAVIPILCYNGTRGNGSKTFFYWFYPAHIYVLYLLSCILIRIP